jgi:ankyrin repeat protein
MASNMEVISGASFLKLCTDSLTRGRECCAQADDKLKALWLLYLAQIPERTYSLRCLDLLLNSFSSPSHVASVLNTRFDKGLTILHVAVQIGNIHTTSYLLQHSADVNAKDAGGWTAVSWAIDHTESRLMLALLSQLLEGGADPCIPDRREGNSLIHWCSIIRDDKNRIDSLEKLVAHGADVFVTNHKKQTPWELYAKCRTEQGLALEPVVRFMLCGDESELALQSAIQGKSAVTCEQLIKSAQLSQQAEWLSTAAKCSLPRCQLILSHIKNTQVIDKKCNQGLSSLHHAVKSGNPATTQFLLQNKAKVDTIDMGGWTPLCWALGTSNVRVHTDIQTHIRTCRTEK